LPLRHEHLDLGADYLQEIAIAGDDGHGQGRCRGGRRERAYDVVGLEARRHRMLDP